MSHVELSALESGRELTVERRLSELEAQVARLACEARRPEGIAMIVFSGDMDKLLSAFLLASGAAAMGMPVTMFFTFWTLPALKRKTVYRGKHGLDRLLTAMLPGGPRQLDPSHWNMLGLGRTFFRGLLRQRHMENLESLRELALELKIRIMVCEPVMKMMALTREELIAGVEFGGVESFLDEACNRSFTLFI